ncbi:MAG: hypothetical protein CL758_04190 [Chloroflexi bacterium]|nr:hypothetical protein [Chloroflexota bacterium]
MLNKLKNYRYISLIPICLGVFIAADDQTVIVTIIPEIMKDMNIPPNELNKVSWSITGYLIGYISAIPIIGRISDTYGKRKIFILCTIIFSIGSMLVALSPKIELLILSRIFQATGAGALIPIGISIISDNFPRNKIAIPIGIIGATAEAGGVIGPLWGGIISNYFNWTWVFWINIPLSIIVLITCIIFIKPTKPNNSKFDYLSGFILIISFVSLTLGLNKLNPINFSTYIYFIIFITTTLILIIKMNSLYIYELKSKFKLTKFLLINLSHLLIGSSLMIAMITIPLMANTVLGLDSLDGGLYLMRMTIAIPISALLGGIIYQKLHYKNSIIIGLIISSIGFFLMSKWNLHISDPALTIHLFITGFGFGMLISPIYTKGLDCIEESYKTTAASMLTVSRLIGMTLTISWISAWGTTRFKVLTNDIQIFPILNQINLNSNNETNDIQLQIIEAGLKLFNEFFLIACIICIIGIIPALLINNKN